MNRTLLLLAWFALGTGCDERPASSSAVSDAPTVLGSSPERAPAGPDWFSSIELGEPLPPTHGLVNRKAQLYGGFQKLAGLEGACSIQLNQGVATTVSWQGNSHSAEQARAMRDTLEKWLMVQGWKQYAAETLEDHVAGEMRRYRLADGRQMQLYFGCYLSARSCSTAITKRPRGWKQGR